VIEASTPRTRPNELGFTLVELMVVVAIIALIAAIIIPNYVHARAQADVAQTQANLKQIATALELYYGDNEAYPKAGTVDPTMFGGSTNPF
jgi:type II secretion system protein G